MSKRSRSSIRLSAAMVGAKSRLKKLRDKESRFRKQTNHCISKEIVAGAERFRIAICDLKT
jgi:hypothetical protein